MGEDNNVVIAAWAITNLTPEMTVKQFIERRRPWIVPPRDPKETEGKKCNFHTSGVSSCENNR